MRVLLQNPVKRQHEGGAQTDEQGQGREGDGNCTRYFSLFLLSSHAHIFIFFIFFHVHYLGPKIKGRLLDDDPSAKCHVYLSLLGI